MVATAIKVIHGANDGAFALPARSRAKRAARKLQPPIMAVSQETSPPSLFSTEQLEQWKDEVAEW